MKYPDNFERDYAFYLKNLDVFDFDGSLEYFSYKVHCHSVKGNIFTLINIIPLKVFSELYPTLSTDKGVNSSGGSAAYPVEFDLVVENLITHDEHGYSAKESFYRWDVMGEVTKTREPTLLRKLLKTKGSVNLHIKMYAEDFRNLLLTAYELKVFLDQCEAPDWVLEACFNQAMKIKLKCVI